MSVKTVMTADDLWAMPEEFGKRFELVRGELVEVPGAGVVHGLIVKLVVRLLDLLVEPRRLGFVLGDGVGFVVLHDPDVVRIPDVAFVSRERVPTDGVPAGFFPTAPDLAVEVVSPTDQPAKVHAKVLEYLQGGTRLVWVLWPEERRATVYFADGVIRDLGPDQDIDGGDVLPGFRVRVGDLFAIES